MTLLRNKFHLKRIFAFVLALVISISLIYTVKPVLCASEGTVIDPIIEAAYNYIHSAVETVATALVSVICGSFKPSFDLYYKLSDPKTYQAANILTTGLEEFADSAVYRDNYIISTIFTFCQRFGVALATIMTVFCLMLCIAGRSEQIRDTPLSLLFKYIVVLCLIYVSWDIVYLAIDVLGDLWTNFVMRTNDQTLTYSHFSNNLRVTLDDKEVKILNNPIVALAKLKITRIDKALFGFLSIFLIWKLFKQFLRLYIEIAERYFVLTMLSLFSPTIIATIVSNSTSNIFSSYLRMFVSQSFVLLINGIFMKIFVYVAILGGWTAGLTNYICALAYMKFCMKIDSYMMSMGLNVAQTGSGLLNSMGGGLNSLVNATRSLGMVDKGVANHGASLKAQGAATNDKALFDKGATLSQGLTGVMGGQKITSSPAQFSKAVADSPTSVPTRRGATIETGGNYDNLVNAANQLHLPSTSLNSAVNSLQKQGIGVGNIHSVKQLDGSKEFSTSAGTKFALQDEAGNNLAFISGNNVYTNSNLKDDIASYAKGGSVSDYASNETFESIGIKLGKHGTIRQNSTEKNNGFGKQHYLVSQQGNENAELWEASMVSQNPDSLYDRNSYIAYNDNGDAVALRRITSQAVSPNADLGGSNE